MIGEQRDDLRAAAAAGVAMRGILVMLGILVMGCGKPQLAPEVEAVRLTYASEQVAACQSKGLVSAKDGRSGLGAGAARRAVERQLRERAHQQGGTVVLLRTMDSSALGGTKAEGEAFACPAP